jgi:DNA-binding LacI/PurR family transcriptional regulator
MVESVMTDAGAKRRVRLEDIAEVVGVSAAAVSMALNGRGTLSESTRQTIIETAERLGYQPNSLARALRLSRTNSLAVVVPATKLGDNPMSFETFSRTILAAVSAGFDAGQRVLLVRALTNAQQAATLAVDGVILTDTEEGDRHLEFFASLGIPVVSLERVPGVDHRWHVNSDNAANTEAVLTHLASVGARRISLLVPNWRISWVQESVEAYRQWCAGAATDPRISTIDDTAQPDHVYAAARSLLESAPQLDAVFCLHERHVPTLMQAAHDLNLVVPNDIRVAAGTDSSVLRSLSPPVTALDLQPHLVGAAAVKLLMARIDRADPDGPIIIPAQLHIRASTAP